jgi:hypothetical protein
MCKIALVFIENGCKLAHAALAATRLAGPWTVGASIPQEVTAQARPVRAIALLHFLRSGHGGQIISDPECVRPRLLVNRLLPGGEPFVNRAGEATEKGQDCTKHRGRPEGSQPGLH